MTRGTVMWIAVAIIYISLTIALQIFLARHIGDFPALLAVMLLGAAAREATPRYDVRKLGFVNYAIANFFSALNWKSHYRACGDDLRIEDSASAVLDP